MQRLLLIACLLLSVMLTSCGFYERKERIVLCKEILATNDTLDRMTREWHTLLDRSVKTKNFSALNPSRIKLQEYISRKRALIADMEVPADAEVLRESEGVFLTNQTSMIADIYPQFEPYTDLTPADTIQKKLLAVKGDQDNELAWKLTIKKSVDAFVQKHGLRQVK